MVIRKRNERGREPEGRNRGSETEARERERAATKMGGAGRLDNLARAEEEHPDHDSC